MIDLKKEMTEIAEKITKIIMKDDFPSTIRPKELQNAVRSYPGLGGKRLRPILVNWCCGLFGGDLEQALIAGASVEIFHNWTLVHDDIIDCDEMRRGVPTCHTAIERFAIVEMNAAEDQAEKFGNDLAILAGDLQQAWANDMMLRLTEKGVAPELVLALCRRMQRTLNRELISGEALDVEFEMGSPDQVSENDVLGMILGKTSTLLAYSMQCGAALALKSADFERAEQKTLADFAKKLGLAFQLQDDLLGVYGEIKQFGKPLCSDFHEGKPTLLYLEAKKRLPDEQAKLLDAMMRQPFYSMEMVSLIRSLLTDCGAEQTVRERSAKLTQEALDSLNHLPDNEYRERLQMLTNELLKRAI